MLVSLGYITDPQVFAERDQDHAEVPPNLAVLPLPIATNPLRT